MVVRMVVRPTNGFKTMVVRPTNGCKDGQCEEAGLDIIPIDGKVLDNHVQILHMITSTRKNII